MVPRHVAQSFHPDDENDIVRRAKNREAAALRAIDRGAIRIATRDCQYPRTSRSAPAARGGLKNALVRC
jgi:hypothetical protein